MPVTLDQGGALCTVQLEGEVNIACAEQLKTSLVEALGYGKEMRVDLERVTELDITALQLLWAAGHKAAGSGLGFALAGKVPESVLEVATDTGFEKFPVPSDPK
jgi:anti-anti-sigma factor